MTEAVAKPRGLVSTALITIVFSAFGGYLWIGRGRFAVIYLVLSSLIAVALFCAVLSDLNLGPVGRLLGLMTSDWFVWTAITVVSLLLVLPFREKSMPTRWFSRGWPFWLLQLSYFVVSSLIAIGIRSFLMQPFSVPSSAMAPTLIEGDYFFADKRAYGYGPYSLPYGPWLFMNDERRLPQRGDIVVFRFPPNPEVDYVMRAIGLPGDRVQMIEGILHLNGQAVSTETIGSVEESGRTATLQRETLPDGASYTVQSLTDLGTGDNTPEFVVPEGLFFVLGDNRDNSSDSRFEVGFVPLEYLVGRADRLFWNSEGADYWNRRDLRPHRQ